MNKEKVRERIAELCRIMRAEGKLRRFTPESDADQILSDKDILIKADDQSLPVIFPEVYSDGLILPDQNTQRKMVAYAEDMLKQGWVKRDGSKWRRSDGTNKGTNTGAEDRSSCRCLDDLE